jgi:hypothetical protein
MENNGTNNRNQSSINNITTLLLEETLRQLNQTTPTTQESVDTSRDSDFNRILDTVYESFQGYNQVMLSYSANMTSMLQCINNMQQRFELNQLRSSVNQSSSRPNTSQSRPRSNSNQSSSRPNSNQSSSRLNSNISSSRPNSNISSSRPNSNVSSRNSTSQLHNVNSLLSSFSNNSLFSSQPQQPPSLSQANTLDQSLVFTYLFEPLVNEPEQHENQRPMSREEISTTTRTFSYVLNSLPEDRRICPIVMENFAPGDVLCEIRGCGHIFRRPPLMNWLRRSSQCPVCRYHIRTYQESATVDPSFNTVDPSFNNVTVRPSSPIQINDLDEEDVIVSDDEDVSDIEIDNDVD